MLLYVKNVFTGKRMHNISSVSIYTFKQSRWIKTSQDNSCPCCRSSHPVDVKPPTDLLLGVLGQAMVTCPHCKRLVRYSDIKAHCDSKCSDTDTADLTLQDILSQPLATEPTDTEKQVAVKLVRKMMAAGSTSTLCIPTGGQVRRKHNKENYVVHAPSLCTV